MENLRKIRDMLGLSQFELAKRTGLAQSLISKFESGKKEPSLSAIIAILKVIPVKFEKLVGLE